jgi:hypothetical protein
MPRFDTSDKGALKAAVGAYLADYTGDLVSALQVWYEGLESYGVPMPADYEAIEAELTAAGWADAGAVREERYGVQKSFKSPKPYVQDPSKPIMIQHMFKLNGQYKTPDGKTIKLVTTEFYNLRAFEMKDGHMTGPMLKIDPKSDYAAQLELIG